MTEHTFYQSPVDRKQRFDAAVEAAAGSLGTGIGRLSEKNLHSVLKYYYEPDENFHEVKIAGYFADIANASGIIEIQTASFGLLRDKLEVFLPSWQVNVVYPVAHNKHLNWLDPESGEVKEGRKSPKKGSIYEIAKELVYIKPLLLNENLSFTVVLVDVDEYKLLNGYGENRKIRARRHDRIPREIAGEVIIGGYLGYGALLPQTLPCPFSTKDYKKESGLSPKVAGMAVNVLKNTGTIIQVGKKGNLLLYERA